VLPVLIPLLLGLGSGLCWGAADFLGGLQARRLSSLAVAFWSQVAGALALAVALALVGQPTSAPVLAWGIVAGVFGGAFLLGRPPGPLALGGIVAALAGVAMVSTPGGSERSDGGRPTSALAAALGAAVGFGFFFVFLDRGVAAGGPPLWVVGGARVGSLITIGLLALGSRRPLPWPGRRAPIVAAVGLVDTTANVLFTYAASAGNLGVVSVLGSLYPVATVLLARVVLAERLSRPQGAGVAVALAGVLLMAAG
jgi:drug/metabolite transporter (DMT)-like permease